MKINKGSSGDEKCEQMDRHDVTVTHSLHMPCAKNAYKGKINAGYK